MSKSIDPKTRYAGIIAPPSLEQISVIIPVKDNPTGVARAVASFLDLLPNYRPSEIIVVDNNSSPPLNLDTSCLHNETRVHVISCETPGAAAARNAGVATASGKWLLFSDSDCIATSSTVTGYLGQREVAVAYAGDVRGFPDGHLTNFYDRERTLLPRMMAVDGGGEVPIYLVTANALVLKSAFNQCGGFNETFEGAGGEDVELSIRLWKLGNIAWCGESVVLHDFSDGLTGFLRRFVRYGRGNKTLEKAIHVGMRPRWSRPKDNGAINMTLKLGQFIALWLGYAR